MNGFLIIHWNLYGQNTARPQHLQHFRNHNRMIRNPLQAGVGKYNIIILPQLFQFCLRITLDKLHFRMCLLCRSNHVRRRVCADNFCAGKALL